MLDNEVGQRKHKIAVNNSYSFAPYISFIYSETLLQIKSLVQSYANRKR